MLATKLSCQSGACSSSWGATGGRRDEYTHGCVRGRERRSGLVRGKTEEFVAKPACPQVLISTLALSPITERQTEAHVAEMEREEAERRKKVGEWNKGQIITIQLQ